MDVASNRQGSWCAWCPITAGYFPFENDLGKGHDGISYLVAHRTSHQVSSKDLQRHGGSEPVIHPYSSYFYLFLGSGESWDGHKTCLSNWGSSFQTNGGASTPAVRILQTAKISGKTVPDCVALGTGGLTWSVSGEFKSNNGCALLYRSQQTTLLPIVRIYEHAARHKTSTRPYWGTYLVFKHVNCQVLFRKQLT